VATGTSPRMNSPIRLARPSDCPAIGRMMAAFYAESEYGFDLDRARAALAELLDDERLGRVWLIVDADSVVGYIVVAFGFSLEFGGRDAFIDELFIEPAHRGTGLGSAVLGSIEPECLRLGVHALHLEVEHANPRGEALYRRQGFHGNDRQLLTRWLDGR
jgi:GNAT superfamily N-acetyltransferase